MQHRKSSLVQISKNLPTSTTKTAAIITEGNVLIATHMFASHAAAIYVQPSAWTVLVPDTALSVVGTFVVTVYKLKSNRSTSHRSPFSLHQPTAPRQQAPSFITHTIITFFLPHPPEMSFTQRRWSRCLWQPICKSWRKPI
jgi:hypothetical protein